MSSDGWIGSGQDPCANRLPSGNLVDWTQQQVFRGDGCTVCRCASGDVWTILPNQWVTGRLVPPSQVAEMVRETNVNPHTPAHSALAGSLYYGVSRRVRIGVGLIPQGNATNCAITVNDDTYPALLAIPLIGNAQIRPEGTSPLPPPGHDFNPFRSMSAFDALAIAAAGVGSFLASMALLRRS
jgi:hypothetical protein